MTDRTGDIYIQMGTAYLFPMKVFLVLTVHVCVGLTVAKLVTTVHESIHVLAWRHFSPIEK